MNARLHGLLILSMTLACSASGFQQPVLRAGSGGGAGSLVTFNKILVSFRPVLSSETGPRFVQSRTYVADNGIQRILFNADGSLYFGYELAVEPVQNSNQFLVSVKALSPESLQKFQIGAFGAAVVGSGSGRAGAAGGGGVAGGAVARGGGGGGGGIPGGAMARGVPTAAVVDAASIQPNVTFSPSQYPVTQRVSDGDIILMDLLANPDTGVKISDLIKVASTHRIMMQNEPSAGPRVGGAVGVPDTTTIWAFGFDVLVDGKLTATVGAGGCTGKLVHFSLEPKQRFIMSTQPYDGYEFTLAGNIDGNSIRFMWNGKTYELLCSEPVLEGGAKAPLWLLVDDRPDAQEALRQALQTMGGAGVIGGARSGGGGGGAVSGGVGGFGGVGVIGGTGPVARTPALVGCGAASNIESLVPKK